MPEQLFVWKYPYQCTWGNLAVLSQLHFRIEKFALQLEKVDIATGHNTTNVNGKIRISLCTFITSFCVSDALWEALFNKSCLICAATISFSAIFDFISIFSTSKSLFPCCNTEILLVNSSSLSSFVERVSDSCCCTLSSCDSAYTNNMFSISNVYARSLTSTMFCWSFFNCFCNSPRTDSSSSL